MRTFLLFLLLVTATTASASQLSVCYDVYYIINLGTTCITYEEKDENTMVITSTARTSPAASKVKKVDDYVQGILSVNPIQTRVMRLTQKEGNKERLHTYQFNASRVQYRIHTMRPGKPDKIEENSIPNNNYYDPFGVSLRLQSLELADSGAMRMFFDSDPSVVQYQLMGTEVIPVENIGTFTAQKVRVRSGAKMESVLAPRGSWDLWIDKATGVFVKMDVIFLIGRAKIEMTSMKGDRTLLKRMIMK